MPGHAEAEIGRTEIARATVNPTFKYKFRLEYIFQEQQTYVVRVYDEDLRYATDLKEHDYLGGCIFTLGQLMGAKGCSVAKKLLRDNAFMVVTGNGAMFLYFIYLLHFFQKVTHSSIPFLRNDGNVRGSRI